MTSTEPRALLPFLQPVYDVVTPLAWPIVRVAVGWNMIVHGYGKIMRGMEKQAENLVHDGVGGGVLLAQFLTVVELGGGIFIALGLFTRFWAAACAIELGYITFVLYWHNGFSWTRPRLRVHADVGADLLRHRTARRRAVFARSGVGAGAVVFSFYWPAIPLVPQDRLLDSLPLSQVV